MNDGWIHAPFQFGSNENSQESHKPSSHGLMGSIESLLRVAVLRVLTTT